MDEGAKREVRRALLKAVALPGHQVPFASPELPIARGWGTGGLQVTMSLIGPRRRAQDHRPGLRRKRERGKPAQAPGGHHGGAHHLRLPGGNPPAVPAPPAGDPHDRGTGCRPAGAAPRARCAWWSPARWKRGECTPRETTRGCGCPSTRTSSRTGPCPSSWGYPCRVNDSYIMSPPRCRAGTCPGCTMARHLTLLGAGREKRVYAVPPYTSVRPLEFEDLPFTVERFPRHGLRSLRVHRHLPGRDL